MRFLSYFIIIGTLMLSSVSCRSAEPEPAFVPVGCTRCVMNLVRKKSLLILETRVTREMSTGQSFYTNTQRIPAIVLKPGEWNELALKQNSNRLERIELILDGKKEQFLYPVQGIYLKVFTEKRSDGSCRLKGFFRSAALTDGSRKMELLATPFDVMLRPGREGVFCKLEY